MNPVIAALEERVNAVAGLVLNLRHEISRLEHDLAERPTAPCPAPPPPRAPDENHVKEIERLRAERAAVRERIRGLIHEIDQVSW